MEHFNYKLIRHVASVAVKFDLILTETLSKPFSLSEAVPAIRRVSPP